jgi:hypothetical protein
MLRFDSRLMKRSASLFAALVWVIAPVGFAGATAADAPAADAPAVDALKQILEQGNAASIDPDSRPADRERIGKLYETNGYRLLWSDGAKPTDAAISFLQELRLAGERGLNPEEYPGNRLSYLLIDLIDSPHPGIEQWAEFDAGSTRRPSGTISASPAFRSTSPPPSRSSRRRRMSPPPSMPWNRNSATIGC